MPKLYSGVRESSGVGCILSKTSVSGENVNSCTGSFIHSKPLAEAQAADANFMIRIAGVRFRRYSIHIESGLFCYPLFPLFFH